MGLPSLGKSSGGPTPPDPAKTAAAQADLNTQSAIDTTRLNQVNQITPFGSATFAERGTVDGIPQFSQTTTLDPADQANLDRRRSLSAQLLDIGGGVAGQVGENFDTPFDFSQFGLPPEASDEARQRVESALLGRLEPQFERDEDRLRNRLANQGITQTTDAFGTELDRLDRAKNDARLGVTAAGGAEQSRLFGLESAARERAVNESLLERGLPLSELGALQSQAGGVNTPQFAPIAQAGIAAADITGPTALNAELAARNFATEQGGQNALLGSLFGLGGSLGSSAIISSALKAAPAAAASDRRVKTNIRRVGTLDNGFPVYAYNYKAGGPTQIGVIAQDVEKTRPEAVVDVNGTKHVYYDLAVA